MTEVIDQDVHVESLGGLAALALELGDANNAIRRITRRAVRQRVRLPMLSFAEVELLVAVVESPGCSVAEMARVLGLAPNTVSSLVSRLVRNGYLERRDDPSDRRVAILRATPMGRARVRRWRAERTELVAHALGALPPQDRMAVRAAVRPLRALADALLVQTGMPAS